MALPHPLLIDGQNVEKSVGRSRLIIWFADAAELSLYDMSAASRIAVGSLNYVKTSLVSGPSGLDVLVDGAGNKWLAQTGNFYVMPFSATLGFGANELILVHPFVVNVTFPENLVGSFGVALGTATLESRFRLYKNEESSPFGEVIFSTALPNPTFESDETVFEPGDYAKVRAPSSIDASLANVGVTLLGTR